MPRNWVDDPTARFVGGTQIARGTTNVSGARLVAHRLAFEAIKGPERGRTWTIDGAGVRIGAAPTNDIRLADETVSRHHCEVIAREDRYLLRDLGSTNGTKLEGVWVLEGWLDAGSRVRVGQTELRFAHDRGVVAIEQSTSDAFGTLRGASPAMRSVFGVLERVAPTPLSVLIVGETGTGKELAARAVHERSRRASGPLVVVDCAALSRNLVESDLFGHDRGAFTGADKSRAGAFERAAGGTIFLDEIGELPLELQPKLLRVLERREVQRLGGSATLDVDVRIVAATHRDLGQMVDRGEFRDDLYYRLAEIVVGLPPLRERRADVAALAQHMLEDWREATTVTSIDPAALAQLAARDWPGNVRELRNTIRRAAALAEGDTIDARVLELLERVTPARRGSSPSGGVEAPARRTGTVELLDDLGIREARQHWMTALERDYLERMRERYGDDVDAIAAHMGLLRKSVLRLLRQHGLIEE